MTVTTEATAGRRRGEIQGGQPERGYVFVRDAETGDRVFAHARGFTGRQAALPPDGTQVDFTLTTEPATNRPRAVAIEVRQPARAAAAQLCRTCGAPFEFTQSDYDWYRARGMQIPRRCRPCRQQARKDRT